jgi:RNA-directed DNA polymerase
LDDHFYRQWEPNTSQRYKRMRHGIGNWRLIRYADDFVLMVAGTREHAEALRKDAALALAPLGLRLSQDKTRVAHIDEGFDFLGQTIVRRTKRGTTKQYVYTVPSKRSIQKIKDTVRQKTRKSTRNMSVKAMILTLERTTRGWANYHRHGVSKDVFNAIDHHVWWRLATWIRHKHRRITWKEFRRRFTVAGTWIPAHEGVRYRGASSVPVTRYRYRGYTIPTPWTPRPASPKA